MRASLDEPDEAGVVAVLDVDEVVTVSDDGLADATSSVALRWDTCGLSGISLL
jgi:hypothetical protein